MAKFLYINGTQMGKNKTYYINIDSIKYMSGSDMGGSLIYIDNEASICVPDKLNDIIMSIKELK